MSTLQSNVSYSRGVRSGASLKHNLGTRFAVLAAVTALGTSITLADDKSPADKDIYWLFNPTPAGKLRELTTDRPDTTESPFTVDVGHLQFETTGFGYSRSVSKNPRTVSNDYEYGTTNIRIGLTNSLELSLIYQPYGLSKVRSSDPTATGRFSGSGDLTIRTKLNFWGNDTFEKPGSTALGLLPFVNIPTDRRNGVSSDFTEGGVIVPFAIKLTDKWDLGLNGGVQWIHNEDSSGYHREYIATASFGYEWTNQMSTYYELAALFNTPDGSAISFGTGVSYKVTKNLQFDTGVNLGLTSAAPRVNPFVGISARF